MKHKPTVRSQPQVDHRRETPEWGVLDRRMQVVLQ